MTSLRQFEANRRNALENGVTSQDPLTDKSHLAAYSAQPILIDGQPCAYQQERSKK
jgi:hypothetical protein